MAIALVIGDNPLRLHAVSYIVKDMGWQVQGADDALPPDIKIITAADAASAARLDGKGPKALPNIPTVVILDSLSAAAQGLTNLGALRALISSDQSEEMIASVIRLVSNGHRIISCDFGQGAPKARDPIRVEKGLTRRESEIAREVTRGRSNKEIGRILGISPNTVEVHVSSLIRKLGVRNRTQVATAVRV